MSILHGLAETLLSVKFLAGLAIGSLPFLIYFSIDFFLLITRHHFGRADIDMAQFTRNDHPSIRKETDELLFMIAEGPVFLTQTYGGNRFLIWWVIYRSWKATFEKPVITFGPFAYMALVPFLERISSRCALGHFKRADGEKVKLIPCWLVMVHERRKSKQRYMPKVLLIQAKDLENMEEYLKNPPAESERNFELFQKVEEAFRKDREKSFLAVTIVIPA
jgi:hypothetical protein